MLGTRNHPLESAGKSAAEGGSIISAHENAAVGLKLHERDL